MYYRLKILGSWTERKRLAKGARLAGSGEGRVPGGYLERPRQRHGASSADAHPLHAASDVASTSVVVPGSRRERAASDVHGYFAGDSQRSGRGSASATRSGGCDHRIVFASSGHEMIPMAACRPHCRQTRASNTSYGRLVIDDDMAVGRSSVSGSTELMSFLFSTVILTWNFCMRLRSTVNASPADEWRPQKQQAQVVPGRVRPRQLPTHVCALPLQVCVQLLLYSALSLAGLFDLAAWLRATMVRLATVYGPRAQSNCRKGVFSCAI